MVEQNLLFTPRSIGYQVPYTYSSSAEWTHRMDGGQQILNSEEHKCLTTDATYTDNFPVKAVELNISSTSCLTDSQERPTDKVRKKEKNWTSQMDFAKTDLTVCVCQEWLQVPIISANSQLQVVLIPSSIHANWRWRVKQQFPVLPRSPLMPLGEVGNKVGGSNKI